MVQKIHPRGVIWVPSSRLMEAVPSIYKDVHVLCYKKKVFITELPVLVEKRLLPSIHYPLMTYLLRPHATVISKFGETPLCI